MAFPPYNDLKEFLYMSDGVDLRVKEQAIIRQALSRLPSTLIGSSNLTVVPDPDLCQRKGRGVRSTRTIAVLACPSRRIQCGLCSRVIISGLSPFMQKVSLYPPSHGILHGWGGWKILLGNLI